MPVCVATMTSRPWCTTSNGCGAVLVSTPMKRPGCGAAGPSNLTTWHAIQGIAHGMAKPCQAVHAERVSGAA